MDIRKLLRRFLPHLVLTLSICVNVLQVLHVFNPAQRFMTSTPSVVLITAATVSSALLALTVIVKDNRKKKKKTEK